MRTTVAAAVAALALGLAGCSDSGQPSPPPTPDQPTTTSSPADTAPTTEAAPPTTESPSETASTDLPPEATEDSEAGAEAFALHYIYLINQTGKRPEVGVLEPLGADGCKSCQNHEESVTYAAEHGQTLQGDTFEIDQSSALYYPEGQSAVVRVDVTQPEQHYFQDGEPTDRKLDAARATLVFRLVWDDGWLVQEITVDV